jgi:hypothetical protein
MKKNLAVRFWSLYLCGPKQGERHKDVVHTKSDARVEDV